MNADLAARKEQLRLRSEQLREQIAARAQVLRPGLRLADRVRSGMQSVRKLNHRHHSLMLLGAALLGVTLSRPRAALTLGLRLWSGWQVLRRVQPVVGSLWRRRG